MYRSKEIEELRPGVFEVTGGGTIEYAVKVYQNTGTWGGHIVETDSGKKIHVPNKCLNDFSEKVREASKKLVETDVGGPRGTRIYGERDGVVLSDGQDMAHISDEQARRMADDVDRYVQRLVNK